MKSENKLLLVILFNLALMIAEIIGSVLSNSLALLGDAGHMLTDTAALIISYAAVHIARRPVSSQKTFGWRRVEVLAALFNGVLLAALSAYIFYEALKRFFAPAQINSGIMLVVAAIGFLGNLAGLALLHRDRAANINVKGAYLHILGDTLSSVGVIIGALLITFTGLNIIDSLAGILIAGVIVKSAAELIIESFNILLEATPGDINVADIVAEVKNIDGVLDFHDVHVWSISTESRNLSGHVLIDDIKASESQKILVSVRKLLEEKFKISHSTLEVECEKCNDRVCYKPHPGRLT